MNIVTKLGQDRYHVSYSENSTGHILKTEASTYEGSLVRSVGCCEWSSTPKE